MTVEAHGFHLNRKCWPRVEACVYQLLEGKYAWQGPAELEANPEFTALVNDSSLDFRLFVHGFEKIKVAAKPQVVRSW
jgi:hypothetical protein